VASGLSPVVEAAHAESARTAALQARLDEALGRVAELEVAAQAGAGRPRAEETLAGPDGPPSGGSGPMATGEDWGGGGDDSDEDDAPDLTVVPEVIGDGASPPDAMMNVLLHFLKSDEDREQDERP